MEGWWGKGGGREERRVWRVGEGREEGERREVCGGLVGEGRREEGETREVCGRLVGEGRREKREGEGLDTCS